MMTFDATVDFETPGLLEDAITQLTRTIGPFETLTVVVRHDNEVGEVYCDEDTIEAPLHADDWCVTGRNAWDVAAQLRARL